MKILLFAGGTGKRFWPVSRKKTPKQFLPIVNDTPLLKLRVDIIKQGFHPSDIFISTGVQYESEVRKMLPELPEENFILEPEMRDTGPAVALAVAYVSSKFPEEVLSVQWSDHLIKNPNVFIKSLNEAEKIALEENKITLITVPARFPSPHRGYINFGKKVRNVLNEEIILYNFVKFVEKPTKEVAVKYLEDGHYGWNPGYWNFKGYRYLEILEKNHPETYAIINRIKENNFTKEALEEFRTLEKISADYQFAETLSSEDAKVLMVDMGWSDVGEWIAFKEALEDSQLSNVIRGHSFDMGSSDTLIYNTQDNKLVATIGL